MSIILNTIIINIAITLGWYSPTTINIIAGPILKNRGVGDVVVDELAKAHHQQAAPLVRVVQISSWAGFDKDKLFSLASRNYDWWACLYDHNW